MYSKAFEHICFLQHVTKKGEGKPFYKQSQPADSYRWESNDTKHLQIYILPGTKIVKQNKTKDVAFLRSPVVVSLEKN